MLYVLSFLMVSNIKYNSFKKPELFKKINFNALVLVILILIFIASQPSIALFLCGVIYVLSGPVGTLKRFKAIKQKEAQNTEEHEQNSHI
jgi:CDP-diacylglycerol--serine O-phosphatidyltransferase